MTRKLSDIDALMKDIKAHGYKTQISQNRLEFEIAKKFGLSEYIKKQTLQAMLKFGYIYETAAVGIWALRHEESTEEEANKEADVLLGKIESSEVEK